MNNFRFKSLLKVSSLMNIFGISLAVAAFYILVVCAKYDTNFNSDIPDYERIYMVVKDNEGFSSNNLSRPFIEEFVKRSPFIEKGGLLSPYNRTNVAYKCIGDNVESIALPLFKCTQGLIETFGATFTEGSLNEFNEVNKVIISRSASEQYGLHRGDVIKIGEEYTPFEISAVYNDFPNNSELSNIRMLTNMGDENTEMWNNENYSLYFKAVDGAENIEDQAHKISIQILKDVEKIENDEDLAEFEEDIAGIHFLSIPLDKTHFYHEIYGHHIRADKKVVYTLIITALMTIILAFINYINFFFSQVPEKLKAVNVKKILGCSRASLIFSVALEAAVHALVASVVAFIIVKIVSFAEIGTIINRDLSISTNISTAIITVLSVIATAVLSSIYPAFYITGVQPALALKGIINGNPKSKLRLGLTIFQFTASIALIIGTLLIKENNDYMFAKDLGFDHENIFSTYTTQKIATSREAVEQSLRQNPDILDVAWATGNIVAKERMGWGRYYLDKYISFQCFTVSWNFLRFLGVEISEGRDFTDSDEKCENGVFIFNQNAKNAFGLTLEAKISGHKDETEIVGFCKDFNYKPLQYNIDPFAFYVFGKDPWNPPNHLYFRTKAGCDIIKVNEFVKKALIEIDPIYELSQQDIISFNQETAHNYTQESQLAELVTMFSLVVLAIALTGLLGVVIFETQRRRKEIGIRKVNGATVKEILTLFNQKFAILIVISFVIASPIAYYIIREYFSNFAYHCPVYWWIFAIVCAFTLIATALTVSAATFKAANENPVNTLKTE
ncbi:MAG: ABC transporter permease [Bacteroidales bacterium]|nr:ABC transporter permease [Bacteroidales bacterium]